MGWGDELMVTGRVREMHAIDPRKVRIVYEKGRWHESWDNNPRIARPKEAGDFQELKPRNGYLRPYMTAKTDERWTWRAYQPPRGELWLTGQEIAFGKAHASRIVIEPNVKPGASPNKDWGWERWKTLAGLMKAAGLVPTQLGPNLARRLAGVEFVQTDTMRQAAAVMAHARAAVLPEGGLHHVAAAVGTPAVVIFGGFISPAVTGYADQVSLFHAGEFEIGCGWRIPCQHCQRAMAAITPQRVFGELERLLVSASRHLAA